MAVSVLCFFLVVPWVILHYVSVAFPGHTHLLLDLLYSGVYHLNMTVTLHTVVGLNTCLPHQGNKEDFSYLVPHSCVLKSNKTN